MTIPDMKDQGRKTPKPDSIEKQDDSKSLPEAEIREPGITIPIRDDIPPSQKALVDDGSVIFLGYQI